MKTIINTFTKSEKFTLYYKVWITIFVSLVVINTFAHNLIIDKIYIADLSKIIRGKENIIGSALEINVFIYAVIAAVFIYFISRNLPRRHTIPVGILYGMMLGLLVFLPHTLTNYIMFQEWTMAIILIELCWGMLQGALVGLITAYMYKKTA